MGQRPAPATRQIGHSGAQAFVSEIAIASMAEVQGGTGRYRSTTGVVFFHGTKR